MSKGATQEVKWLDFQTGNLYMLSVFQRKRPTHTVLDENDKPGPLLTPNMDAATLLANPRRAQLLNHIWQRTALSPLQHTQPYRVPLEHNAELVQHYVA